LQREDTTLVPVPGTVRFSHHFQPEDKAAEKNKYVGATWKSALFEALIGEASEWKSPTTGTN
jgi:hypothetical protein